MLLQTFDVIGILPLEQAAIDQQGATLGNLQPVAAAGYTRTAAVVENLHVVVLFIVDQGFDVLARASGQAVWLLFRLELLIFEIEPSLV